jgi:hypothetical protein
VPIEAADHAPAVRLFFQAASRDDREARAALATIGGAWRHGATDALMFDVPHDDGRLKNKTEVLALNLPAAGAASGAPGRSLAISVDFLKRNPVHHLTLAGQELVAVTSAAGANRVYAPAPGTRFVRQAADALADARGRRWRIGEEALVSEDDGQAAPRVAARRAFWFGWHAQFPDTELVR